MIQVLIVEDEVELGQLLKQLIECSGMQAHVLHRGDTALRWIKDNEPDIIILDLMLPGLGGADICRAVRQFSDVPIIMATAKVEEFDRLSGFELGANDYVCKPYSSKEVIARIQNLVRLCYPETREPCSGLSLDKHKLEVSTSTGTLSLTAVEFRLLSLLKKHPKRVYSREQILCLIYDDDKDVSDRAVDSLIKNIRKKLKKLNQNHNYIRSVYGAGYQFELPSENGVSMTQVQ
ncbi:response regulator [Agaribacterium haliotis]|uniref:response regulator n=1 Tax=Agaribacterium haliotis TaxID=2013869 RepID=UPI001959F5DA|nr:response regulator [Agaribacterium haliotis]